MKKKKKPSLVHNKLWKIKKKNICMKNEKKNENKKLKTKKRFLFQLYFV